MILFIAVALVATLWMILFTAVAAMLWTTLFTAVAMAMLWTIHFTSVHILMILCTGVPLWTTQGMVMVTVACMAAVLGVATTMTAWATVIVACLAADTAWVQHLWMMHLFGS